MSTAHALGFGVYRNKGLVQIFENKDLWFDIGYEESDGVIEDGQPVTLNRTPKSSPEFLEQHSPVDDLIQFEVFETPEAQTEWLVAQIKKNFTEDELIPDDIVVMNPDPFKTKDAVGDARWTLMQMKINSNLAGVTRIADIFTEPGTVCDAIIRIIRLLAVNGGLSSAVANDFRKSHFGACESPRILCAICAGFKRNLTFIEEIGCGARI